MTTFDFSRQVVLNVTTTDDQNDGSEANGLSLRDAILQANANPSKEYIINLPSGTYNLTIQNILQPPTIDDSTSDLETLKESRKTTGDLDISGRISIIAEDPTNTIISGAGLQRSFIGAGAGEVTDTTDLIITNTFKVGDRVFDVASGGILNLENVTVRDGLLIEEQEIVVDTNNDGFFDFLDPRERIRIGNIDTVPNGAAINVEVGGTAIINNSIISDSISEVRGGGINNTGILTLNDSIVKNNEAKIINFALFPEVKTGGGIFNSGILNINRSSIIDNLVQSSEPTDIEGAGGGITNNAGGTLTIVNSTISGNDAGVDAGGGILNRSRATIVNSTINNNTAQVGGGIYSETTGASTVINNTIVANNKVRLEFTEEVRRTFPQFNVAGQTTVNFADEFVWDVLDGNNNLIQPSPDDEVFTDSYYDIRILYRSEDPFSPFPSEGLDISSRLDLENLVFDTNADIQFVFNRYSGEDLDNFFSENNGFVNANNNLVQNVDQNFGFAYRNDSDNLVFLETDFEFDAEGKLILVLKDPTVNPNTDFTQDVFVADKLETFTFETFNNTLILDDNNKNQASFVRDQNNQVRNYSSVVNFQNRTIATITTEISDPPLPTDIDGFFGSGSSFNLIGSSSANGILNGVNNNIVGTTGSPLNPLLEAVTDAQGNIIAYQPLANSPAINAGNNDIVGLQTFFGPDPVDQFGNPRISNGTVNIGSVESGASNEGIAVTDDDSLLNTSIYRFQNKNVSGTYLYAGSQEAQSIRSNFPNFVEEGVAFKVGVTAGDDLIPIYRFQNTAKPGTYLYAGEQERQSILINNRNFKDEGIAFYVYGADANKGQDIYRFQDRNNPGTYLFVGEAEKNNILANFNNLKLEGVAFEVGI
jgi:hypothetical protein